MENEQANISNQIDRVRRTQQEAQARLEKAQSTQEIEKIRLEYLGRSGSITGLLRSLKDLSVENRRTLGPVVQSAAAAIEQEIKEKLKNRHYAGGTKTTVDLTVPPRRPVSGRLHPLTHVQREIIDIFRGMNFSVIEGAEVESEYYNFDALNIPAHHPARDMWDTFWLKQSHSSVKNSKTRLLLRTQTSAMQVRYMEINKPPFQIIVPGRVFRHEATDATHELNFYQLEGLMVSKDVTLANFKFVIEEFFRKFFGGHIEFRYRPSYFPFVEPGLEVDVRRSKKEKWLEVMGAGMVHPRVFEYAHYNPRDLQGFAFGIGIDRLLMIKYAVPDIRLLYSGDTRLVKQW